MWRAHAGPQAEVLSRSETEILFGGSRGGGKTEAGLAWMLEPEYTGHPQFRSLVIRRDYDDLDDWIQRARMFYDGQAEIVGNPPVVRWRGGGVTRIGHWKDKTTISKYIGKEYQKMLLEEINQGISSLEEYKMLLGSLRTSVPELRPQVMANTNPGGPGHMWVKKYWIEIEDRILCEGCHGIGCDNCGGDGSIKTGKVVTSRNRCYTDPVSGYTRIFIPSVVTDNPSINETYVRWLNSLPEPLRSAWRDGSWEVFEGQFFGSYGARGRPFSIERESGYGRLFGSLDIGITHNTSFGMYYLDMKGGIHRLFTYKANGGTHRGHAEAIRDRIETFRWTGGVFPVTVWVGHDAWTRTKLREDFVMSPIDEYDDVFRGRGTRFVKANIDRENGCMMMRAAFNEAEGYPQFSYWHEYNRTYEEDMQAMQTDKNHPETYHKVDGDDTPDECRYGVVGLLSLLNIEADKTRRREKKRVSDIVSMSYYSNQYQSMMHETSMG